MAYNIPSESLFIKTVSSVAVAGVLITITLATNDLDLSKNAHL